LRIGATHWRGVGKNRWHGERHSAGCRHVTHIGQVPYPVSDGLPRNIQTVRNLLLRRTRQPPCQRISDYPPALCPHSRGFRQYLSNSVTGHCRPWPVPVCDHPTTTWLPSGLIRLFCKAQNARTETKKTTKVFLWTTGQYACPTCAGGSVSRSSRRAFQRWQAC
jgi:hypothetical protein